MRKAISARVWEISGEEEYSAKVGPEFGNAPDFLFGDRHSLLVFLIFLARAKGVPLVLNLVRRVKALW